MKYITDILVDKISATSTAGLHTNYSVTEKELVLKYVAGFEPCLFTSAPVIDVFTGEQVVDADNGFSDGNYTWYASEIYYFKNYNLLLGRDFIDYVAQIAKK